MARSDKMYKDSPKIDKDENGKAVVKKSSGEEKKEEATSGKGEIGDSKTPIQEMHDRHLSEMKDMHKRHQKEHTAMSEKHGDSEKTKKDE